MESPDEAPALDPGTITLIRRYQGGDRDAVERLFTRYLPRVRQIVALRTSRSVSSLAGEDDIVQEAMVRAFRNLDHFQESSEGTFRDYLARCVESSIRDAWRHGTAARRDERRTRHPGFDLSTLLLRANETPSQVVSARELQARIEGALLEMDDRKREVIVLRHLCGKSYAEVATDLGLGREGTVRVLCFRALEELKSRVGDF